MQTSTNGIIRMRNFCKKIAGDLIWRDIDLPEMKVKIKLHASSNRYDYQNKNIKFYLSKQFNDKCNNYNIFTLKKLHFPQYNIIIPRPRIPKVIYKSENQILFFRLNEIQCLSLVVQQFKERSFRKDHQRWGPRCTRIPNVVWSSRQHQVCHCRPNHNV